MIPTILYFEGEPVDTLSRDRLIEALYESVAETKAERESHASTRRMLALAMAVPMKTRAHQDSNLKPAD